MDGNLACSRISSIISISGRKSRCLEQCLKFYRSILWLRCILTEWETPLSPFLSLSLVLLLTAVVIVTRGPETSLWPGWGDVPGPPGDGGNSLPSLSQLKKIDTAFLYLCCISFLKYLQWLHMETAYDQEKHKVFIWIKLVIFFGL